jgi:hypothetical protein
MPDWRSPPFRSELKIYLGQKVNIEDDTGRILHSFLSKMDITRTAMEEGEEEHRSRSGQTDGPNDHLEHDGHSDTTTFRGYICSALDEFAMLGSGAVAVRYAHDDLKRAKNLEKKFSRVAAKRNPVHNRTNTIWNSKKINHDEMNLLEEIVKTVDTLEPYGRSHERFIVFGGWKPPEDATEFPIYMLILKRINQIDYEVSVINRGDGLAYHPVRPSSQTAGEYEHCTVLRFKTTREKVVEPAIWWFLIQARKRHFLSHLYIKCIILPRQARDKHRENSKNDRFLAAALWNSSKRG